MSRLSKLLPIEVALKVDERSASAYQGVFEAVDICAIQDLEHFGNALDGMRKPSSGWPK